MNRIKELLSENFNCNDFKLIDREHPLSLYIGRDESGHFAFEYVGKFDPHQISSSKSIIISNYKNSVGDNSIVFSLVDASKLDIYCAFCEDLVESTRKAQDESNGYQLLINRYYSWKELLLNKGETLDKVTIKGLIGELLFIKEFMIPTYGKDKAISSWTGPEKMRKDFSLDETWYEVKTITAGKDVVKITSFEQLDSDQEGTLAIYQLEDMSPEYDGLKINKLVREIIRELDIDEVRDQFLQKLFLAGYKFETSCDRFVFEKRAFESYRVSSEFPCLRRCPQIDAIAQASYDLIISKLTPFKK